MKCFLLFTLFLEINETILYVGSSYIRIIFTVSLKVAFLLLLNNVY